MSADGIVFVHGGKYDSRYWQPTMEAVAEQAPGVHLLAVDLPGRRGMAGDMSLSGCVNSAVAQVRQADMGSIVLVGHSLAGVTMPG
ncbi:alpha/beta fold hydrolase, partial [Mycobacterium sp.]